MRLSRIIVCAFVAALLCGCANIHTSTAGERGERVKDSEFSLWPLVSAERTVYTNGVQQDGNVLCFIQWSTWHGARSPKARCVSPSTPAPESAAGSSGSQTAS